jgi:hypothetical protein
VILSTDKTRVVAVCAGASPDHSDKPGYAEIADDDPRIVAFEAPPVAILTNDNGEIYVDASGNLIGVYFS